MTFPSHAAAILPLHHASRGRLWLLPLIAGSAAPDLAYVSHVDGAFAHSPLGLVAFCLPAGLILYMWLETLLLPALRASAPVVLGFEPGRLLRTRGLPRDRRQWAWVVAALLLGALTHLIWDGFTHRLHEPARSLYGTVKVSLLSREVHLSAVLQHLSTVGGAALVLGYAWRRYPALPAHPGGRAAGLALLAFATALGGSTTFLLEREAILSGSLHWGLWLGFWVTARGALVGLTAGAAAVVFWLRDAPEPGLE